MTTQQIHKIDNVFIKQINELQEMQNMIQSFESILEIKNNEFCCTTTREFNEYNLWQSILQSDITHYKSEIQSYELSLQELNLQLETISTNKLLEKQKTFAFEIEVNKLRNKYDLLNKKIKKETLTYNEEYNVFMGISKYKGEEIIFSSNIFSLILSFIDIEKIFKLERVSMSWYDAIHHWSGWIITNKNNETITNNLNTINNSKINSRVNCEASDDSEACEGGKLYYQRFRRFSLSIETQKNNMYQIEIVGYSDKNISLSTQPIINDKIKKRVTIQPIQGQKQFAKEFSICDVILGNHQRLARIKEKCERLKSRCESDKNTQKGYQMTTKELQNDINILDKHVKELELQQNSDLNTIKFLKEQIIIKQNELNELKEIPAKLQQQEDKNNAKFLEKLNNLENEPIFDNDLSQMIHKTQNEKDTLTKAIKLEQSNLRSIIQQRDELKDKYERLKDQITKLTRTDDL